MSASEWTAIGIFVVGLVVSLLVYIVQFLHRMDKRAAVDTIAIRNHEGRISTLETTTSAIQIKVSRLDAQHEKH